MMQGSEDDVNPYEQAAQDHQPPQKFTKKYKVEIQIAITFAIVILLVIAF